MDMIEEIVENRGAWHATMQGEWLNNNSLEGLMLKLKVQYFGHLMQRANSLEKTLMLEKTEGQERKKKKGGRGCDSITTTMDMNLSKLQKIVKDRSLAYCSPQGRKESDMTVTEQQQILSSSSWGLGDGWQARKQETIYCCHYLTHQNPWGSAMNLSKKQKQTHRRREQICGCQGGGCIGER